MLSVSFAYTNKNTITKRKCKYNCQCMCTHHVDAHLVELVHDVVDGGLVVAGFRGDGLAAGRTHEHVLCVARAVLLGQLLFVVLRRVHEPLHAVVLGWRERERNGLFNDALNTFYLRLYGVRHMVNDHSDSERGNPLPPYRLLLSINSKGSFICTIPQTG